MDFLRHLLLGWLLATAVVTPFSEEVDEDEGEPEEEEVARVLDVSRRGL